jgi:Co/Zn/Cd efflux system component
MTKKPLKTNEKKNNTRKRIIYLFLILLCITVLLGAIFIASSNWLVSDLYTAFVLSFIGISFLYISGLILCSFFIYLCFVITIFNPQKIKRSSVFNFAIVGVIALILSLFLLNVSVNESIKAFQDIEAYSNGEWQVKEMVVNGLYRGGGLHNGPGVLIDTVEGELSLHWENSLIQVGEKYQFTYLDATNTIIEIEKVSE